MNTKKFIYQNGDQIGQAHYVTELPRTTERMAVFKCRCGNEFPAAISNVKRGIIKGCGCWRKKHGHTVGARGKTKVTTEYNTWQNIIDRCTNSKNVSFLRYGARGITVCERWAASFDDFVADMGMKPTPSHSIERIDNAGNYEPSNCKWETRLNQARNKRNNVFITYNGETLCMAAWAEKIGIMPQLFWHRIKKMGWSVEDAITKPVRRWPKK